MRTLAQHIGSTLVLLALWLAATAARANDGLVVLSVAPESTAARAGFAPGDLLLRWQRIDDADSIQASGEFDAEYELREAEIEQAPRGKVVLVGRRGDAEFEREMAPGEWGILARPPMPDALATDYENLYAGFEAEDPDVGFEDLAALAQQARELERDELAAWLSERICKRAMALAQHERAVTALERSLEDAADGSKRIELRLRDEFAKLLQTTGDLPRAREIVQSVIAEREARPGEELALALSLRTLGVTIAMSGDLVAGAEPLERALELRRRVAPGSLAVADLVYYLGILDAFVGNYDSAVERYEEALAIQERLLPDGLEVAATLFRLGNLQRTLGETAAAEQHLQRARIIQERLEPDGLALSQTLQFLASIARARGDIEMAREQLHRALEIQRAHRAERYMSSTLSSLGLLEEETGNLPAAARHQREALDLMSKIAPGSNHLAVILMNLAIVLEGQGDLAGAERALLEALRVQEKNAPDSREAAIIFHNLGMLAGKRHNAVVAHDYLTRALAIYERDTPGTVDVAFTLRSLAVVAMSEEDWITAEKYVARAMEILTERSPQSLEYARGHLDHAKIASARGDADDAASHAAESLRIAEALGENLVVASALGFQAELLVDQGKDEDAVEALERALGICRNLRPESEAVAEHAAALAAIHRRIGLPNEALVYLAEATGALTAQRGRLGGTQLGKADWASHYADIYREHVDLLAERGQDAEAFAVLERSRARALVDLLAEREFFATRELPDSLTARSVRLRMSADALEDSLSERGSDPDDPQVVAWLKSLRRLRGEQEEIQVEIRSRFPRLAALRYPEPLTLDEASSLLRPGIKLVAYQVGRDRSWLFVAGESGLELFELGAGREELRDEVVAFREAIAEGAALGDIHAQGSKLYDQLLRPAEASLEGVDELLIVPDGPLHVLPFAALTYSQDDDNSYLVGRFALTTAPSVTAYANLVHRPPAEGDVSPLVVAFGDPELSAAETVSGSGQPLSPVLRDRALQPLPFSREEVERIAELYPDRSAVFVGASATEAGARRVESPAYLHFATHALLDQEHPLDSALVLSADSLSAGPEDDGLLQAWEIFDAMRIDSDVVVLSACETALGREIDGEGLFGLTQAFFYAGARSVLASLWSVSDRSTAEFMTGLYGHLREGLSPSKALRQAQLDMLRSEDQDASSGARGVGRLGKARQRFAHPFHWAAFRIIGDG